MNLTLILKVLSWGCRVLRWLTRMRPHRGRFLIVEDKASDAYLLKRVISKRGWESEVATSGEVAAGMVKHSKYSAVFVDMRLPQMSGAALLRILSEDAPSAHIVIVCGDTRDLEAIPASQFICVIKKPANLEAVEDMLNKLKL